MQSTKTINGRTVTVDAIDAHILESARWGLNAGKGGHFYVVRRIGGRVIHLHREIMRPPEGMVVDHIDGDPLNNTRANLRICTPAENRLNRRVYKPRAAAFKGINLSGGRLRAQIQARGKVIQLGPYKTQEAAALAYDVAARIFNGAFACLNFPNQNAGIEAIHPRHRHKLQAA